MSAQISSDPPQTPSVEAIVFLRSLSGEPLAPADVTPSVNFISALCAIAISVMFADGKIVDREREQLNAMLAALLHPGDRPLVQKIVTGMSRERGADRTLGWLVLAQTLSPSQRLLLLSLGYEMAAADSDIDPSELDYLRDAAQHLGIEPQTVEAIEAIATDEPLPDARTQAELRSRLDPVHFPDLDIRLVGFAAVELLSRLTGQRYSQVKTPPELLFIAALIVLTLAAMEADGNVTPEEQQLLEETVGNLLARLGDSRIAARSLLERLLRDRESCTPSEWLKLTDALFEPERLLLLAFAFEIAAADRCIDSKEREYLQAALQSLRLDSRYGTVLDAAFCEGSEIDEEARQQMLALLDAKQFQHLDAAIAYAARRLSDRLTATRQPQ